MSQMQTNDAPLVRGSRPNVGRGRSASSLARVAVVLLAGCTALAMPSSLAAPAPLFNYPGAMAVVGDDVFVVNQSGNTVVELSASTRDVLRVLAPARYKLDQPEHVAAAGEDLFIVNQAGSSVLEVNASTAEPVRFISGAKYELQRPSEIATYRGDVFVTTSVGVTEFSASTGALVRVISGAAYDFNGTDGPATGERRLVLRELLWQFGDRGEQLYGRACKSDRRCRVQA